MLTLPSSQGIVDLSDKHPGSPVVEPGYFSTALERPALSHDVCRILQLVPATEFIQAYVRPRSLRRDFRQSMLTPQMRKSRPVPM